MAWEVEVERDEEFCREEGETRGAHSGVSRSDEGKKYHIPKGEEPLQHMVK